MKVYLLLQKRANPSYLQQHLHFPVFLYLPFASSLIYFPNKISQILKFIKVFQNVIFFIHPLHFTCHEFKFFSLFTIYYYNTNYIIILLFLIYSKACVSGLRFKFFFYKAQHLLHEMVDLILHLAQFQAQYIHHAICNDIEKAENR
jgi:hypothetical protein